MKNGRRLFFSKKYMNVDWIAIKGNISEWMIPNVVRRLYE